MLTLVEYLHCAFWERSLRVGEIMKIIPGAVSLLSGPPAPASNVGASRCHRGI